MRIRDAAACRFSKLMDSTRRRQHMQVFGVVSQSSEMGDMLRISLVLAHATCFKFETAGA